MRAFACLVVCLLLGSAFAQDQEDYSDEYQPRTSTIRLAAQLASIASRLAGAAAAGQRHRVSGARQRMQKHDIAPSLQHKEPSAVENINLDLVQSVPVDFKGHKLTVVALASE
jgi:hypothetical protein